MDPLVDELDNVLNSNLDVFALNSEKQLKRGYDDFNDKQNQKNIIQKQIEDAILKIDDLQNFIENQEKEIKHTRHNLCKYLTENQE